MSRLLGPISLGRDRMPERFLKLSNSLRMKPLLPRLECSCGDPVDPFGGDLALNHCLVVEQVAAQASARPQHLAIDGHCQKVTFAELERNSNQLAHHLCCLGVVPDTLVGLCFGRSVAFIVGALAVLKAGGAYVCLDTSSPRDRLGFMIEDSRPAVVLTDSTSAQGLPTGKCPVLVLDGQVTEISHQPVTAPGTSCKPENLAYVIYTSGSSGTPKGVEITHRSLLNLVDWHRSSFEVTPSDRASQLANVGFDAAAWELWPHLAAGASVHIPDEETRMTPELLRDWLVARRITISFVPTPLVEQMLALSWPKEAALRIMLTGGDTLHRFPSPGLPFILVNNYGPTECTVVATSGTVFPTQDSDSVPAIGRPIANTEILILDSHMRPVPVGEIGEIYIGGMSLARGYHNRPELTAERFLYHPFSSVWNTRVYKTGDLGRWLPDGQISFAGRQDDQVKVRGFRVEPAEITSVLDRHPSVQTSVVLCSGPDAAQRQLVAYLVPAPGHEATASELRSHIAKFLPEYMIPSVFVRLNSIPVTANGKVDRKSLPVPDSSNILRETITVQPKSPLEKGLAAILSRLLKLDNIGRDENIFLIGGHSLLGIQLISKIRETFQVELSVPMLFQKPTIRGLATQIEVLKLAKRAVS
jgi:amino acid adenylation domain-containing protein